MIAFLLTSPVLNSNQITDKLPDESLLVNELSSGDLQAFAKLYKMYAGALYGIINKIVCQQETAEDLLQDTFMKIKKGISAYDPSKSRLFTWISRIARNTAIDHLRLKNSKGTRLSQPLEDSEYELDRSHTCSFNPDKIGIKQLLSDLSGSQQEIIDLVYYRGFTHEEVAKLLNMPIGTVKTKVRMSIQKLRSRFN